MLGKNLTRSSATSTISRHEPEAAAAGGFHDDDLHRLADREGN
jgi:hypothetical protein